MKSIRSVPGTVKLVPQPGASGSVGGAHGRTRDGVADRVLRAAQAVRGEELREEDGRRAAPETAGREAHDGLLVGRPGDAETRRELVGRWRRPGFCRVRLKEPLAFAVVLVQDRVVRVVQGLERAGRTETVSLGDTNHWSCRKSAVSFWPKLARPASSEVRPPRPPNWRYWLHLPARKSASLLKMKTPRQLPLKTWSIDVSLYSKPALTTWSPCRIGERVADRLALGGRKRSAGSDLRRSETDGALTWKLGQVEPLVRARRVLVDVVEVEVVQDVRPELGRTRRRRRPRCPDPRCRCSSRSRVVRVEVPLSPV